jgi:hypothetical protein
MTSTTQPTSLHRYETDPYHHGSLPCPDEDERKLVQEEKSGIKTGNECVSVGCVAMHRPTLR